VDDVDRVRLTASRLAERAQAEERSAR
jgi:hypothetical protein